MDQLDAMMFWENGDLEEDEMLELFQNLVNSGLAW